MERLDIPTIVARSIEGAGIPLNSQKSADIMNNLAELGSNPDARLDQIDNCVFISITKETKNKIKVAYVAAYLADPPKTVVSNFLRFLRILAERRVGLARYNIASENMMPAVRIIGQKYPTKVVRNKETGVFTVTSKLLGYG